MRPSLAALLMLVVAVPKLGGQTPREGRIDVGGIGLHYRIAGAGPDTVLVPLGSVLAPALEPLAAGRTVVFYDMRGRGRSDPVADPARLGFRRDVDDLEAVRRHVGAGRASVVGYSYLGAVAARYTLDHPERVDRLVLLAPLPPRAPHPDAPGPAEVAAILGEDAGARLREIEGRAPSTPEDCREWWRTMLPLYTGSATDRDALMATLDLGCHLPNERPDAFLPTLAAVLGDLGAYDWRGDAGRIRRPVLVVHGADDRAAPPAGGREWAEAVEDGHFEGVEGAGHLLLFERAAVVLELLDAFLPRRGGGTGAPLTPAPRGSTDPGSRR